MILYQLLHNLPLLPKLRIGYKHQRINAMYLQMNPKNHSYYGTNLNFILSNILKDKNEININLKIYFRYCHIFILNLIILIKIRLGFELLKLNPNLSVDGAIQSNEVEEYSRMYYLKTCFICLNSISQININLKKIQIFELRYDLDSNSNQSQSYLGSKIRSYPL